MKRPTLRDLNAHNRALSRADELHWIACRLNKRRDPVIKQIAVEIKKLVKKLRDHSWRTFNGS